MSFLTGIVTGSFVILFSKLLEYFERLLSFNHSSFYKTFSFEFNFLYLLLPAIGGLLVGLITHYLCSEARGNGIDHLLDAFHNQNGEMRGRVSYYKAIVTIITLSTGGSAGKEGPSAQIGASIGSKINNVFAGGARARRTLLLAGAAASLGTIFQAPLGGAITAIEMVYREDIESDALIPSIISSVSAYFLLSSFGLVHREYFALQELAPKYLTIYPILGLISFGIGFVLVKIIQRLKAFFLKWKIFPPFKPMIGGLICGVIYLFFPVVSGTGESYIENFLFKPETYTGIPKLELIQFVLFVVTFKIFATTITIASGGSGGIFGPSLFLGGTIGMFVAEVAGLFYTLDPDHYRSFILVGMGSFYAGIASAPIAAMIMICEMVGSYVLLPPLMVCSIIVFLLSKKLNLYSGQVQDRFHSPAHHWDIQTDILRKMPIYHYQTYLHRSAIAKETQPIQFIKRRALKRDEKDFIILNESSEYVGIISSLEFMRQDINPKSPVYPYIEKIPAISISQSLGDALELLLKHNLDKVAVISNSSRFLGYLRYQDILELYFSKLKR
ncbi:MAG TPA: chloride channel protein [Leptospiraceae bacterium]|nr:chloride channel protein [Leptospiraceae bacterium]HMX32920.1 chloride channel protein [Leptospiraceae bacterium]HMY31519.1 chloride channel protein [Leptospiraceae bacterium]HNA06673.1 chloride channel protein [Leptospiraceae bacterium]HNC55371.1 chloride channel protein [Leptospiraceae bacterium]